tara:strand:- start:209 stop:1027 length:819 start_codon:yes stop_codon:yes gene_type:complete
MEDYSGSPLEYANNPPSIGGYDEVKKQKKTSVPKAANNPAPQSVFDKFKASLSAPQTQKQKDAQQAAFDNAGKSDLGAADQKIKDAMNSGIGSLSGGAKSNVDMYADNLKRYNDYMESQKPPPPTEITPEMRNAALSMFESQQGAGQMPYYMAAGLDPQATNMSPAFQYAAQNYDTLGGSQRLAPRPIEMMSVAERNRINDMSQAMADSQLPPPPTPQMNEGQQYEMFKQLMSGQGGKGNAPTEAQPTQSDFGRMLAARFGGGNQGGGGFGF